MTRISVSGVIETPVATVWDTITNIERLPDSNPDIVSVEFLSEQRTGPGTRFKETRANKKGRQMETELELVDWREHESAQFVSDQGGTLWDTTFYFASRGEDCELSIVLDATPHNLLARLMLPLVKGMVKKGMQRHVDAVKAHCETIHRERPI